MNPIPALRFVGRVAIQNILRNRGIAVASILTITSYPARTSPVLRGKWVLENLLDSAPPPPPPNVPALAEGEKADLNSSLKERMEQHRANPACAARYQHLTSREQNKLPPTQAQAAIAAALLRHLHAVVTTGQRWDPDIAAYGIRSTARTSIAA